MNIQIKNAKLKSYGNSYCVLVPMDFIKNEMVNLQDEYDVIIKPVKKESVDLSVETISNLTNEAVMKETKRSI